MSARGKRRWFAIPKAAKRRRAGATSFAKLLSILLIVAVNAFGERRVYSYEGLVGRMLKTSPKLQQAEVDVLTAIEGVSMAKSGYYPSLRVTGSYEHSKKYIDAVTPSYVGEDSLTQAGGRYLSSSIYLSYDLFRFGATRYSVDAAYAGANSAILLKCDRQRESLALLLEAYAKVRVCNLKIEEYEKILDLYRELYTSVKRLYESGRVAKTSGMEYAEELANTVALISDVKNERVGYLSKIVYLSGERVDQSDIFLPLGESVPTENTPFESSVTARRLMAETARKQAELSAKETGYLPSISLYGKYDLYGSSSDSSKEAYDDFKKNGYRVGVNLSWSLFDGFKSSSDIEIKRLELLQSRLAYEDAKMAYEAEQYATDSQIAFLQSRLKSVEESASVSNEFALSDAALYDAGELDKITLLNNRIDQRKIYLSLKEAEELLSMSIKKREIANEKESRCVAR
jgi:outer membrane protein TolC